MTRVLGQLQLIGNDLREERIWESLPEVLGWEYEASKRPGLEGEGSARIREDRNPWGGRALGNEGLRGGKKYQGSQWQEML